ncbi:hypothetical protein SAY87_008650 [Trapa incisa]|uniref:Protein kinase domain-containing protein n=1 Tax=Trapa incisa TaxID=236973 RepID=A0AAN7PWH5_9MYRT|nr:hypothetical protein SAY87_008650 [Trapa incisa]
MKSSISGSIPPGLTNVKDLQLSPINNNVDIFTYQEMWLATKHFRPDLIIGEGGFGIVYKGVIDDSVRQGYKTIEVAIKELNPEGFQGDREWLDYNPKLSDFGLAKEGPVGDQTHVSTRIMGTYGYAAPEYIMTGHLTARSDVYGFGVVLLELLIGRGAMEKNKPSQDHSLVEWARPILNNKNLPRILDPRMEGQYSIEAAMEVGKLAHLCLSPNPKSRPLINEAVETLKALEVNEEASPEGVSRSSSGQ